MLWQFFGQPPLLNVLASEPRGVATMDRSANGGAAPASAGADKTAPRGGASGFPSPPKGATATPCEYFDVAQVAWRMGLRALCEFRDRVWPALQAGDVSPARSPWAGRRLFRGKITFSAHELPRPKQESKQWVLDDPGFVR